MSVSATHIVTKIISQHNWRRPTIQCLRTTSQKIEFVYELMKNLRKILETVGQHIGRGKTPIHCGSGKAEEAVQTVGA